MDSLRPDQHNGHMDVKVAIRTDGYVLAAEPGTYGIQGFPAGLEQHPAAGEPLSAWTPSLLRWLLTPEGQAVAAWLGVALGIASIAFTLSD